MGLFITTAPTIITPANATLSNVTVSTTSAVILAANPDRQRFTIWNNAGRHVFVAFAATATTTAFSIDMPNNSLYESDLNDYSGVVSAITSAGSGPVRVTEITI